MKTKMVCLEDGITSCGFRKMAAYVAQLEEDTESCYITTTKRWRSVRGRSPGRSVTSRTSATSRSTRSRAASQTPPEMGIVTLPSLQVIAPQGAETAS